MFNVDINQLRRESKDLDFEIPINSPFLEGTSIRFKKPVLVKLRASRHEENTVFIKGNMYSKIVLSCRRCLEEFDNETVSEVMLVYQLDSKDTVTSTETDVDDEIIHIPYHTNEIDIGGKLREIMLVDYPIYSLCKEDCAGICQMCGGNLNLEKCQCKESHFDQRWDELLKLKS